MLPDALIRARNIKLIAFDIDGVMTDGTLYFGDDGQEYKAFNSLDGHGLKMLQGTGVELAIITGRSSRVVDCGRSGQLLPRADADGTGRRNVRPPSSFDTRLLPGRGNPRALGPVAPATGCDKVLQAGGSALRPRIEMVTVFSGL